MAKCIYSRNKELLNERDIKTATTLVCVNELHSNDLENRANLLPCHQFEFIFYSPINNHYAAAYTDLKRYYRICEHDYEKVDFYSAKIGELHSAREYGKQSGDNKHVDEFLEKQAKETVKYLSKNNIKTKEEN